MTLKSLGFNKFKEQELFFENLHWNSIIYGK